MTTCTRIKKDGHCRDLWHKCSGDSSCPHFEPIQTDLIILLYEFQAYLGLEPDAPQVGDYFHRGFTPSTPPEHHAAAAEIETYWQAFCEEYYRPNMPLNLEELRGHFYYLEERRWCPPPPPDTPIFKSGPEEGNEIDCFDCGTPFWVSNKIKGDDDSGAVVCLCGGRIAYIEEVA